MLGIRSAAHFDKDVGAIRRLYDEVDFATSAPARPIIARNQPQALTLQIA
jgi:hypothetical protein